jgi:hypothetical protein
MGGPNGEVMKGDLPYDGGVILYILKGIIRVSLMRVPVCYPPYKGQLANGTGSYSGHNQLHKLYQSAIAS